MSKTDTPGVIAPPPLIFLGFLLLGWGLATIGARPGSAGWRPDWGWSWRSGAVWP